MRRKRTIDCYDADNQAAARKILADLERYGGEGSLMVTWAREVLAKAQPDDAAAGPLFKVA